MPYGFLKYFCLYAVGFEITLEQVGFQPSILVHPFFLHVILRSPEGRLAPAGSRPERGHRDDVSKALSCDQRECRRIEELFLTIQ
jgi:hypothetical protein